MEQVTNAGHRIVVDVISESEAAGPSHSNLSTIADAENLSTELYPLLTSQKKACDYVIMAVQIGVVVFITPLVTCACVLVVPFYIAVNFAESAYEYFYYDKNLHMFNALFLAGLASTVGFAVGPVAGFAGSFFVSGTMIKNVIGNKPILNEINLFGDIAEDARSFSDSESVSTIEADDDIP